MTADLRGRWRRTTAEPCAVRYPAAIDFREATYPARKGPDQGFVLWDAGTYDVSGLGRVTISTASDELVGYRYTRDDNTLTFVDPDGCAFSYEREV